MYYYFKTKFTIELDLTSFIQIHLFLFATKAEFGIFQGMPFFSLCQFPLLLSREQLLSYLSSELF